MPTFMGVQNTAPSVFSYSTFIFICYKCMEVGNLAYISHFFYHRAKKINRADAAVYDG